MPLLTEVLVLERPLIGLDLETTGVNQQTARIVELALEIMVPGKDTKEYRTLVNPGIPIPKEASDIHHITDDMVKDAPTFDALADNLLKGFSGSDFAGYNVRFDLRIISAEFRRAKRVWDYEDARVIDGFRLWQIAEGRSLEHAVKRWIPDAGHILGEADGSPHSALFDVKMATRVIAAELRGCSTLPRDMQMLHDLCAPGWFDAEGKLQWKNGELYFTFGEHKDKALRAVPRGYLDWITKKDFSSKVKDVCRAAIRGEYPTKKEPNA